jgi:hypothetical protein
MTCAKPKSIRRLAEFKHELRALRAAREVSAYHEQTPGTEAVRKPGLAAIVIETHRMV